MQPPLICPLFYDPLDADMIYGGPVSILAYLSICICMAGTILRQPAGCERMRDVKYCLNLCLELRRHWQPQKLVRQTSALHQHLRSPLARTISGVVVTEEGETSIFGRHAVKKRKTAKVP